MKLRLFTLPFLLLACLYSCHAQNGPTSPSVTLSWVQSTGNTNPIAKNCIYRGSAIGTYSLPALFCSTAPITTFKDTTVTRGSTFHYAVTAQDTLGAESAFSLDVAATPPIINAPTGLATGLVTMLEPSPTITHSKDGKLVAVAK